MSIWEESGSSTVFTHSFIETPTHCTEDIIDTTEGLRRYATRVAGLLINLKTLGANGEAVRHDSELYPLNPFQVAHKDRKRLPRDDDYWKSQIRTLQEQFQTIWDRLYPYGRYDEKLFDLLLPRDQAM